MRFALYTLVPAPRSLWLGTLGLVAAATVGLAGCGGSGGSGGIGPTGGTATQSQVTQGRYLVTSLGCADCHNRGTDDPSNAQWLAGYLPGTPGQPFQIGPPGHAFNTYPANLTPDATTGLGGVTDLQVFNALRYGLDPMMTPSVVITSTVPGQGNFPATPHYLAPPMPWPSFRHLSDADTWSIVAYLKHGIKPVTNAVTPSQGPPDFWASSYTDAAVGPASLPTYPAGSELFNP